MTKHERQAQHFTLNKETVENASKILKEAYASFAFHEAAYREAFAECEMEKRKYREIMKYLNPIDGADYHLMPSYMYSAISEHYDDVTHEIWARIGKAQEEKQTEQFAFWIQVWSSSR